jgi:hypothetical protein
MKLKNSVSHIEKYIKQAKYLFLAGALCGAISYPGIAAADIANSSANPPAQQKKIEFMTASYDYGSYINEEKYDLLESQFSLSLRNKVVQKKEGKVVTFKNLDLDTWYMIEYKKDSYTSDVDPLFFDSSIEQCFIEKKESCLHSQNVPLENNDFINIATKCDFDKKYNTYFCDMYFGSYGPYAYMYRDNTFERVNFLEKEKK